MDLVSLRMQACLIEALERVRKGRDGPPEPFPSSLLADPADAGEARPPAEIVACDD